MTVNQQIINALDFGIPCKPDVYTGDAKEYITFTYNTIPAGFGDDAPDFERYLIQVHYVCPPGQNSISRRKAIKQALSAAGFTWPFEFNLSDADGQGYAFECETLEGADAG